jgi:hypothetical protein
MKSGEPSSYCKYHFDLPKLVGSKETPISPNLLRGSVDVQSHILLELAFHFYPDLHLAHLVQVHQPRMRV